MIRYKVVTENRGSCTVPPQNHKYYRKYNKGDTVYAEKDSFGIMVFATVREAVRFPLATVPGAKILKVKPVGKTLKRPKFIFCFRRINRNLARFYKTFTGPYFSDMKESIPNGTLFYCAVKVLD